MKKQTTNKLTIDWYLFHISKLFVFNGKHDESSSGRYFRKSSGKAVLRAWGAACDSYWDLIDAHVICQMLGYKAAENDIHNIQGATTTFQMHNVLNIDKSPSKQ